jgi:hypothetical protein
LPFACSLLTAAVCLLVATQAMAQDSGGGSSGSSSGNSSSAAPSTSAPSDNATDTGEPSPYLLGVIQTFTAEDNLFRAPEGSGQVVSDRISSTGVRLGVNQPVGRQFFSADLAANVNRYRTNKQLNNTDYRAAVRLDWQTVERVSGQISASQTQSLYREQAGSVIDTERNQLRTTALGFQARVGLTTRLSFEVGAAGSRNDYTGSDVDNQDLRQHAFNAGVRYGPSAAVNTRLNFRRTDGTYPRFGAGPDDFTRDDIDLITTLQATGASHLDTRLSATRERHTVQSQRDVNGWTGALGWRWQPTGKLSTALNLVRDSSVGQTGFDSSLINASSSDTSLAQTASLAVTWAATAKIRVIPKASYVHRKLDSGFDSTAGTSLEATDHTTNVGLGLRWTPINALDLGCDVAREQRKVKGTAGLSLPYTASVVSCSAQFALR